MPMIYCTHCGTKISGSAKFCPICGTQLQRAENIFDSPTGPSAMKATPPRILMPESKASGSKSWIPWTIAGVCIVGALIILAFWYADFDSPWGKLRSTADVEVAEEETGEEETSSGGDSRQVAQPTIIDAVREVATAPTPVQREVAPKPMRIVCGGSVENEGKIYPIRIMVALHPNGTAIGRYAYESTLKRAGDIPASWFTLNGTWTGISDGPRNLHLVSTNPADNQPFEDVNISIDENNHFSTGYIINKNVGSYHALELDL